MEDETPIPDYQPDAETFEETCARLGITLDDSGGSEIIFASTRLAAKLQKQSRRSPCADPKVSGASFARHQSREAMSAWTSSGEVRVVAGFWPAVWQR